MSVEAPLTINELLLDRLNPQQIEAVSLKWGPSLVIAGAGSGKTTVLTRRIAYLISQLNQDPESILAVTFTNKAAGEMKSRIESLVGYEFTRRLFIGTFHSICARFLRQEIEQYQAEEGWRWRGNFVIYDETDSLSILKSQIAKLNLDEKVFAPRDIKYVISAAKNDGYSANRYATTAKTYRETRIAEIFTNYQGELAHNNALDFDDLILIFNELLKKNSLVRNRFSQQFRHILVDEFQDTNKPQYDLIRMLSGVHDEKSNDWHERSLMVVGDVDQSIYSWRKADFRIILGLQKDFKNCQLIKLEENYRSTSTILEVANSIISNNTERIEKVLRCNRGKGSKVQCYEGQDEIDEAYYVVEELKRLKARGKRLSDCLILYRTNAQSRAIEEVLVRNHITYTVVGSTRFYDRKEIKDILAYLKLVFNDQDGQAFHRVVNVPKRGIGKTTIDRLISYSAEHKISLLDSSLIADKIAGISPKTVKLLQDFAAQVKRWQMLTEVTPPSALLDIILKETKYLEKLEEDTETDDLALSRIENIQELIIVAKEFEAIADTPDLASFLTRILLVSELDNVDLNQDAVKLMTLHSAKGLEFPIVFLLGLEEGLLPHVRSLDSPTALEEERRLLYVGVTRAADLLYMTMARKRMLMRRSPGSSATFSTTLTIPSRFLKEVTPGLLSSNFSSMASAEPSSFSQSTSPQKPRAFRSSFPSRQEPSDWSEDSNWEESSIRMSGTAGGAVAKEVFEHLKVGDIVQHTKFGIGQINQVIGEGDKELYNIEFKTAGKRLLDPRFAKLIKIS